MSDKRRQRRRRNRDRKNPTAETGATADPAPTPQPAATATGGPHVVVALASTGRIHEQTLGSMQTMIRSTRTAASVEMWWQNAYPGGHCRNLLVERFLADPSKTHLLFVDTDMVLPANGLDALLEAGEPLVCGPAPICPPRKNQMSPHESPFDLTTNIMDAALPAHRGRAVDPEDTAVQYTRRKVSDIQPEPFHCDVTGMAFCLIARDVLERMTPPWFFFVDTPERRTIGLDIYFFRKARQLGYKVVVMPDIWCDHVKAADITHIEQMIVARVPDPRWNWIPPDTTPATMVIACTTHHWLDFRTAEILIQWQERLENRIGVRLLEAADVGTALTRWLNEPTAEEHEWERILLLGPDVIPTPDLVDRLASVDAPVVSTLTRGLIDGEVAYSHTVKDEKDDRVEHPLQLDTAAITGPFDVHHVDLACSMIKPETCHYAVEAMTAAIGAADLGSAFSEQFCDLLRRETGRSPTIAPICVERIADVGLLGLLQLKHRVLSQQTAGHRSAEPAGV